MEIKEIKVGDKITSDLWETMEYVTVSSVGEDYFIGTCDDQTFKFTNLLSLKFYEQER